MKILIVKTSSLGDMIQAFGAVDYLKNRFPDAQIDWVTESAFAELIRAHPQVNQVWVIDSKKWRSSFFSKKIWNQMQEFKRILRNHTYDLLFDLQGNLKSGLIVALAKAEKKIGFGWKTLSEWPNALFTTVKINPAPGQNIREDYLAVVKNFFHDISPYQFKPTTLKLNPIQQQTLEALFRNQERPTLVCPGSAWPNKSLSKDQLIKILQELNEPPYWFAWGNAEERANAIQLSAHFAGSAVLEKLSLPLLQHVMSRSKRVIAMDSLPLHLCGTTETPSLSFFGPSSAQKFRPLGNQHRTIQGHCPYHIQFDKRCPKLRSCQTGACLKNHNFDKFNLF